MKTYLTRFIASVSALSFFCLANAQTDQSAQVVIKLIAFNDFHGNIEPPHLSVSAPSSVGQNSSTVMVPAGGAAYLASAIKELGLKNPNHAVVAAGDLVGASPLSSGLFLDEPTIEIMNAIGLDLSSVGNHEFDKGWRELLRLQNGGCAKYSKLEPCQVSKSFSGAKFKYLAANVVGDDGATLLPATAIKEFKGENYSIKIGFIGMTLKGTPSIVIPSSTKGLKFLDEAQTVNNLIPVLKSQGANVIVVLLHQGGETSGGYNDKSCPQLKGGITSILENLDTGVDVVVSGHTHRSYICDYVTKTHPNQSILLTSAGLYGTLVTDIDLTVDVKSKKLIAKTANNFIVQSEAFMASSGRVLNTTDQYPKLVKDEYVSAIVDQYVRRADEISKSVVGHLPASITRVSSDSGENALGELIADAQLAAAQFNENGGAQIAFENPGGVRADILVSSSGGDVSYDQIFRVQPFGNNLVVKTFTGAQIKTLLEQQFFLDGHATILLPSKGFTYDYRIDALKGDHVGNIRLNGALVEMAKTYQVVVNSFLAEGGDGFSVLKQGLNPINGVLEVDALKSYLQANPNITYDFLNRVRRF